ncbi:MAG: ornithine carbamoyltransferase [Clostridia bacterium]|nr:ornithine carbamoyltransferase [Clostridia bacterium]
MKLVSAREFRGRDFLSLYDYSPEEINFMLDFAERLKDEQKKGITHHLLKGKTLGMIFKKSSTRTRVSFEVGMYQLGGFALFLSKDALQLARGETIEDTGKVFSRYLDGIMIRTFDQAEVEKLAEAADIPVINGLTDLFHPCQALTDIFTIREHKGKLKGIKLVYVGDGNNVANSLLMAGAKTGMNVVVCCPPGYEPHEEVLKKAVSAAELTGAEIQVLNDPATAMSGADVVYTDVWASMGQESEAQKRAEIFKPYQLNGELLKKAKDDCIVMHCLPAHRGEEITDEVIDGEQSVVFEQAENRLHVQKAVMALIMAD